MKDFLEIWGLGIVTMLVGFFIAWAGHSILQSWKRKKP